MSGTNVHLEQVEPGKAPGGFWVRICSLNRLVSEYALNMESTAEASGSADAELTIELLKRGEHVWIYFYDGDSGECKGTITSMGTS